MAGDLRRAHSTAPVTEGLDKADGDEANPDIGARLCELRKMHGFSQRELAKRAGVTNGTISLIEQNRISPSIGSLKKGLDGFPISIADFLTLDLKPRSRVFYEAKQLREIAGGDVSFRLVGRDTKGRAIQMMHERYAPGADTGDEMLSHAGEECGIVISAATAETAGVDLSSFPRHDAELRGRGETISIYTLPDDADPMASAVTNSEAKTKKSA